jgi:[ribosomal protein S18]-alanine N-acetyltransferase
MTLPPAWPHGPQLPDAPPLGLWRAMLPTDVDAVHTLDARAYPHPWSRANFADAIASGYVCACLCAADGTLMGHVVVMRGVDEMHLLNITVAPEHQGRGLGSAMLRDVMAWSQAEGAETLWLEVRQSNERARRLYVRGGFEAVGQRKGYYPDGRGREDAVVMRLALPAPRLGGAQLGTITP